jgi:hypothetical protein
MGILYRASANVVHERVRYERGLRRRLRKFLRIWKKTGCTTDHHDSRTGTTIQATITQLTELSQPDENLFAIEQPTPPEGWINQLRISETTMRSLSLTSTEIEWPAVEHGLLTGGCALYVSADRTGHMREVWPGGCDNNELMTPLREMVRKWQLKTATVNGVPVQVEARLTFPVKTTLKSKSKTD